MYIYSKQQWEDTQWKHEKVVTVDEIFAYFVYFSFKEYT